MKLFSSSQIGKWIDVGFAVIAVLLMYQIAQAAQRPSCTLFNDGPVTVSNGTATLAYTVQERPTSVTISPTVSGTPQLGQPDPERSDYLQMGEIETKALTKTTKFEMTVRNSAGISKCSTTVYYKLRPAKGWDVPLVSQEPVFRRTDIPGGFDNSGAYFPFIGAQWIPGGYFVVSGNGNSGGVGSSYKTKPDKFESGGMYLFNENGSFIGARDVVYDTSTRAAGCFEAGGCSAGTVVHPTGQGRFVRDLHPLSYGFSRSPVQYEVASSGTNLLTRLFFNTLSSTPPNGALTEFSHIAVAGGKMFGIGSREDGAGGAHALEVYDLNFTLLGKYSKPWVRPPGSVSGAIPSSVPIFTPLAGVGDYILGTPDDRIAHDWAGQATVKASIPLNVYKAPSLQDITNHVSPQKVQTLEPPSSGTTKVRFAFDSANPKRIALLWGETKGGTLDLYEAGTSGLTRISRMKMGAKAPGMFEAFTQGIFAVSGDHVVYGDCPGDDLEFDGGTGGHRWDSCEVVVQKISTGKRLSVEPLPDADQFISDYESLPRSQSPNVFAISPNGNILVSAAGFEDWGNLYLYQIGGVSAPPVAILPPSGTGTFPGDLVFTSKLAENILRVMGSGQCPTQPTNTKTFEDAYFRAVRGDSPVYIQDQFFGCVFQKALAGLYAEGGTLPISMIGTTGSVPPTLTPPVPPTTGNVTFEKVLRTYDQNGYNASWGSRAFEGTTWLSSGDLVVTGSCTQDLSGGASLFGSNGSYKGIGNTCSDTSSIRLGCSEAGGCQMGTAVAERPDGSIVRLGQSRNFVRRSPVVYNVESSGLSFVSRIFFSKSSDEYTAPQGSENDWDTWASYYDPVVTSGDILVVRKGGDDNPWGLDRLVAFNLPEFDELWTKIPTGEVVGGIKDLFIQTNTRNYPKELVVYRVSSSGLTEIDREPINGLWKSLWGTPALKKDPKDSSVFAIKTGTGPRDAKIVRYRASSSGIQKIDERTIPSDVYGADFAIFGEYIAFGTAGPRVWKGTKEVTVEKPAVLFEDGRWVGQVSSVSFSKDGKLSVANGKNVLLYKIGGTIVGN